MGKYEIEIQQASEPSDIIWENRHFTPSERTKKKILVWMILVFMLVISFALIFICASKSALEKSIYPDVSCTDLEVYTYGNDLQN